MIIKKHAFALTNSLHDLKLSEKMITRSLSRRLSAVFLVGNITIGQTSEVILKMAWLVQIIYGETTRR
jgi:hypothetical protein